MAISKKWIVKSLFFFSWHSDQRSFLSKRIFVLFFGISHLMWCSKRNNYCLQLRWHYQQMHILYSSLTLPHSVSFPLAICPERSLSVWVSHFPSWDLATIPGIMWGNDMWREVESMGSKREERRDKPTLYKRKEKKRHHLIMLFLVKSQNIVTNAVENK